ncbi:helix-turn-helix domain-containing protein [Nocardioides sp.]|uniref:helix-turn-helix domain-containing protein n=1 Tax=Nocardioides sp. TaxID=35761 RepID=UPI003D0F00E4
MRELNPKQRYYTDVEVAEYINQSVKTIRKWRRCGYGPAFHKFGRSVRYSYADIKIFEQQNRHINTSSNADVSRRACAVDPRAGAEPIQFASVSDAARRDK